MAVLLYTALVPLWVTSAIDSWPCPLGGNLPLDPSKQSTLNLLAAGEIELAASNAVDTVTPANVLRGVPGLKVGVSN